MSADDGETLHCGHDDAELVKDPFIEEVYGEVLERWMCRQCWLDRKEEV